MSETKDFYKITDLSKDFDEYNKFILSAKEPIPAQTHIQLWQARFMLAIAQQLAVVATNLGRIIRKANEQ